MLCAFLQVEHITQQNTFKLERIKMKKIISLCIFLLATATTANAGIITNFTDDYDVSNWSQSLDGGSIDLSGAPLSIIEISSNGGAGASNTDFTIAALTNGFVSFDWLYTTSDDDGSSWDTFGWLLNGAYTQVTTNGLFADQSGNVSFYVDEGDVFGFRSHSVDSAFGSASTTVSNFSLVEVPEPSSLAIIALALAGLSFSRKNKAS